MTTYKNDKIQIAKIKMQKNTNGTKYNKNKIQRRQNTKRTTYKGEKYNSDKIQFRQNTKRLNTNSKTQIKQNTRIPKYKFD